MRLAALLRRLTDAGLLPASSAGTARQVGPGGLEAFPDEVLDIDVDHLTDDSREIGPGGLFVAIRGHEADGHRFIEQAVENGAAAVLCEALPDGVSDDAASVVVAGDRAAFVRSPDTRAALAEAAAAFYGDPSHELKLVGVTGTNGKTTTAYLVRHVLRALGETTALIGTVETDLGAGVTESTLTTPGPVQLQDMLRTAAGNGCTAGAMEVSSHALDQQRTRATRFAAGVFTNLTPEHLDYHGTLDAYRAAKKRLFDALPAGGVAIYNADDLAGEEVVRDTPARKISFGERGDVRLHVRENRLDGLRLALDGADARAFRLVGRFNAYNLAAAYAAARAMGYEQGETLDALAEAPPVPGRFEQVRFPATDGEGASESRVVIVDYAHTPDALENVLRAIGEVRAERCSQEQGAVWCVFGCGGDRDRAKRPRMGRLAEQLADRVVVTSDNPRTENPAAIIDEIRAGLEHPEDALFIEDRRAAIRETARRSTGGDVILIAGKGHETYQIIGAEKRSFDDRKEAKKSFGRPPFGDDT
jgi:UDP-N-acetylmuramoyl-L-alanyl-D-glutamate--2,6-diaminopimelate ligase